MRSNIFKMLFALIAIFFATRVWAQNKVTGTVINQSDNTPIAGASVLVRGTTRGTNTNNQGKFSIAANQGETLVISSVGFAATEIQVGQSSNLSVSMQSNSSELANVVVVGYGTQKKVSLTSAVSQVKGEDLTKRPVSNLQQALQGMAPGLTVLDRGGAPGRTNATIRVRGITALSTNQAYNNNEALVIIDGIEQRMSDVNPDDIESVSILKDAASTAIYGSRAGNGVILITTKRAKTGKVTVSYNGYYAIQRTINKPRMMGLEDYMRLQVMAYTNAGVTLPARFSGQSINTWVNATDRYKYPLPNVWYETLYHSAPQLSNTIAISGGTDRFKARMSVRYMNQQGILQNFDDKIREIRVNTDYKVSEKINVSADVNYRYNRSLTPVSEFNVYNYMLHASLWAVPKFPNGTYGLSNQGQNPLMYAELGGTSIQNSDYITGNVKGEWNIAKGLKFTTQFGARVTYIYQKNFANSFTNTDTVNKITKIVANNSLNEVRTDVREYTLNNFFSYENTFGNHNVKALAGYSEINNELHGLTAYRERFYNNTIQSISQGTNDGTKSNSGADATYGLRSFFGRINYAFENKYLFEANGRYDGSSRFTGKNQYSFFPSFSAGWRLSQEDFWDAVKGTVNEFKLRGSWGKTGNQTIPLYSYFESLSASSYSFGGAPVTGYRPSTLANKDITWETTTQTDIGMDASLFKNVSLSFDYYNKRTDGILLDLPIPGTIGLLAPPQNAGVVENKGVEIALGYRYGSGKKFRYDISGNLAINNNKVISLAGTGPYISGNDIDPRYAVKEGLPINVHWGYETAGLFQSQAEVDKYPTYTPNSKPGDVKYVDRNNDGRINADDMTMIGTSFPKYTFGLNSSVGYGNFEVSLLFQGAADVDTRLAGAFAEMGNQEGFTHTIYTNNVWTPQHTDARFPRPLKFDLRNVATSDRLLINGTYVRLKNLQVSYKLPASLINRFSMSQASVYVSGTNLLTFSKLNEWNLDPEVDSGRGVYYPQTSLLTFGVNIQF